MLVELFDVDAHVTPLVGHQRHLDQSHVLLRHRDDVAHQLYNRQRAAVS